jgi:hypothetical protein
MEDTNQNLAILEVIFEVFFRIKLDFRGAWEQCRGLEELVSLDEWLF